MSERTIWQDGGREVFASTGGGFLMAERPAGDGIQLQSFHWGLVGLVCPGAFRFEDAVKKAITWAQAEGRQSRASEIARRGRAVVVAMETAPQESWELEAEYR